MPRYIDTQHGGSQVNEGIHPAPCFADLLIRVRTKLESP
jgi:hypothetical protein